MKNPEDKNLNINVRLLRKIQAAILAEPELFDMSNWVNRILDDETKAEHLEKHPSTILTCGTAACIAGWALPLSDIRLSDVETKQIAPKAQELLGLTYTQAKRLFFVEETYDWMSEKYLGWPKKFAEEYEIYADTKEEFITNAQIAAARIDHFIQTKGAE